MITNDRSWPPVAAPADPGRSRSPEPEIGTPAEPDAARAWLDLLTKVLPLPDRERDEIRQELEQHLRDRIRDLVLDGASREAATRGAIDELGDAALVAGRFVHAHRTRRRRLIMNVAVAGVGALALGVGVVVTTGTIDRRDPSVFVTPADAKGAAAMQERGLELAGTLPLDGVIADIASALDREALVHWPTLEPYGVEPQVEVEFEGLQRWSPAHALERIGQRLEVPIEWRLSDGLIEIATRDSFDARERVLAAFELEPAIVSIRDVGGGSYEDAVEAITSLIHEQIEPDGWQANGGDGAALRVVGGKLFVNASPRLHAPIQWVLDELAGRRPEPAAAGGAALGGAAGGATVVPRLQPGDIVRVHVLELTEADDWYVADRLVGVDGTIELPQIGSVPAAGLTTTGLERALRDHAATVLRDPMVQVDPTIRKAARAGGGGRGVAFDPGGHRDDGADPRTGGRGGGFGLAGGRDDASDRGGGGRGGGFGLGGGR